MTVPDPADTLFTRSDANPIITPADWPEPANAVFNPAAATVDGETLLLVRVEDRTGRSRLGVARSADGLTGWTFEPERALLPDHDLEAERYGIEDPRITRLDDEYLILYTGYSPNGALVCLASTSDFHSYRRRGVVLPPENKDAGIFPEAIGGRWAMLHRPVTTAPATADIWLSWSPDLEHWGDHRRILSVGEPGHWDGLKVGLGPPPLPTPDGWLVLYHGVRGTAGGAIYRAGLALLDRQNPARVLARSPAWVFGPEAPYERSGDVGNVVFPCGWIVDGDGDTVRVYYGAADTSVCLATTSLSALLGRLDG